MQHHTRWVCPQGLKDTPQRATVTHLNKASKTHLNEQAWHTWRKPRDPENAKAIPNEGTAMCCWPSRVFFTNLTSPPRPASSSVLRINTPDEGILWDVSESYVSHHSLSVSHDSSRCLDVHYNACHVRYHTFILCEMSHFYVWRDTVVPAKTAVVPAVVSAENVEDVSLCRQCVSMSTMCLVL